MLGNKFIIFGNEPIQVNIHLESISTHYQTLGYNYYKMIELKHEDDWQQVFAEVQEFDLFASLKILEIKAILSVNKNFIANIEKVFNYQNSNTVLIFLIENMTSSDLAKPWVKQIESDNGLLQAKPIQHYNWLKWVRQRFKAYNLNILDDALQQIAENYSCNTTGLENLLKNIQQSLSNKTTISLDDCKVFLNHDTTNTVFSLIDAILNRNKKHILTSIQNLHSNEYNILAIISHVHKFTKILLELTENANLSTQEKQTLVKTKYQVPNFKFLKYQKLLKLNSITQLSLYLSLLNKASHSAKEVYGINSWHIITQICCQLAGFNFSLIQEEANL